MKDIIRTIEDILKREFHCDNPQANLVANWILDEVEKSEKEEAEE